MTRKKTVRESAVEEHTYKIFPNDLNTYGTAFGGMIMAILDRIALVVAERHSEQTCVTASIDSVHFLKPAKEGDILLFSGAINRAWTSSMEIGTRVIAENVKDIEKKHILSAYFTFVALDEHNRPIPVPELDPKTADEKRRYEEANFRRNQRKRVAKELKQRREDSSVDENPK